MEPQCVTLLVQRLRAAGYEVQKSGPRSYSFFGIGHEGTQARPGVHLTWDEKEIRLNGDRVSPSWLTHHTFRALS